MEQKAPHFEFPRDLFNYKYIPLLRCEKPYIVLMGSGASGKSVFAAQKEIVKSFTPGNRCLCIRKVKDTIKESCFEELKTWISNWNLDQYFIITQSPMKITNKLTGSDFVFRGMDSAEKIKSISGLTRIWVEEANELSRQDIDQLDIRLRGEGKLQMTFTYNPVDQQHFLNVDYYCIGNTKEVEVMHSTYLDNRFVSPKYHQKMLRLKDTNPTYYAIYALGEFAQMDGLVYPKYKVVGGGIPADAVYLGHGMDFGYRDPTAIIGIYKYKKGYLYDEEYYESEIITRTISKALQEMDVGEVHADSAEPDRIEEIYSDGVNIYPAKKGPGSIVYGIDKMSEDQIYITSTSKHMLKEIVSYCWKVDKNGNVVRDKDGRQVPQYGGAHTLDAARYGKVGVLEGGGFDTILVQ